MRDKWYADNRDLVKWATLSHIARAQSLQTIVQVPYWRPEEFRPHFDFRGEHLPVSDEAWGFFRNIHHITGLAQQIAVSIHVVAAQFKPDQRKTYIAEVCAQMERSRRPLLLFLDPDTGLEPTRCSPKHTSVEEIEKFWACLKPLEWLVLYQHARRTSGWAESAARQLSSLCGQAEVQIARSKDVGRDVAFICVEKKCKT
jgi:hypothetical protein